MMVKICGITRLEDAQAAVDYGASALGFVFHPPSPRCVTLEQAGAILGGLRGAVWTVGIFVDQPPQGVADTVRALGLDIAQLHGNEGAADYPPLPRVWKAWRINGSVPIRPDDAAEAWLLDGPASGQPFDWTLAAGLGRNIVLAGGLDAANVRRAIECAARGV